MARKLRLEYPGACYHVINRGNYRQDVFATAGARAAFETCLFEACAKSGWLLHAFVVMRGTGKKGQVLSLSVARRRQRSQCSSGTRRASPAGHAVCFLVRGQAKS